MTHEYPGVVFTREDLADAQGVIDSKPPGLYVLRELYDDVWDGIWRPRAFGKGFRAAVGAGRLKGIAWIRKRSDRCHLYEVMPR